MNVAREIRPFVGKWHCYWKNRVIWLAPITINNIISIVPILFHLRSTTPCRRHRPPLQATASTTIIILIRRRWCIQHRNILSICERRSVNNRSMLKKQQREFFSVRSIGRKRCPPSSLFPIVIRYVRDNCPATTASHFRFSFHCWKKVGVISSY